MKSDIQQNIWRVQRDWEGETVIIIAGGPSVTDVQVRIAYDAQAKVIVINDAYLLAPWADILFGSDAKWWKWHKGCPDFTGKKVCLRYCAATNDLEGKWTEDLYPEIESLIYERRTYKEPEDIVGISTVPGLVVSGKDGGYQAIQLAIQLGAEKIVLLGFDMKSEEIGLNRDEILDILGQALAPDYPLLKKEAIAHAMLDIKIPHWHGHHPDSIPPPFDLMLRQYQGMNNIVSAMGVKVFNCSPDTDLHEFDELDIEEALRC